MNLKTAKAECRTLGFLLRKTEHGEYRIVPIGAGVRGEAQAYYTDSLDDAVATARAEHNRAHCRCDQCEMLAINGVPCHETGCPNAGARWDGEQWIKQRKCRECGNTVDHDDPCCNGES